MAHRCLKAAVRSSAAQWSVDAMLSVDGGEPTPCFFSVVPAWCTFQAVSGEGGEKILTEAAATLGPLASEPQVVKGGACGGEEEDAEFPFVGAMLSATWEFPKEERDDFIARIKRFLGPCDGLSR